MVGFVEKAESLNIAVDQESSSPQQAMATNDKLRKMSSTLHLPISSGVLVNMLPMLKDQCCFRATRPSNILNKQMQVTKRLHDKKSDIIQFISPFTACIRKTWMQLCLIGVGTYLLCESFSGMAVYDRYGVLTFQDFRLDAMNPGILNSMNVPGALYTIDLLWQGCVISSHKIPQIIPNNNSTLLTISLASPLRISGFSMSAEGNGSFPGMAGFWLRGSNNNGMSWETVGASDFRAAYGNIRFLDKLRMFDSRMTFDFRPPWPLFADWILYNLVFGLGSVSTALCGALSSQSLGKRIFVLTCVLLALNECVAGCGYVFLGLWKECFKPFTDSLMFAFLAVVLTFMETLFFTSLRDLAFFSVVCSVIRDCVLFQDPSYWSMPSKAIAFVVVSFLFTALRHMFLKNAITIVRGDRACYDAEWREVTADPVEAAALRRLGEVVARVAADCPTRPARQYNRRRLGQVALLRGSEGGELLILAWRLLREGEALARDAGTVRPSCIFECVTSEEAFDCRNTMPGQVDEWAPVLSLDQLYAQALGVVGILHARCAEWAAASGGALVTLARDTVSVEVPGGSIEEGMMRAEALRYIKDPGRAMNKVLTCYRGDVSKLLDVCRGRIVFDRVEDLATCLEAIYARASSAKVVRVRNYLTEEHNSWLTAGFRAVIVNVCFDDDETRVLGVETHVCEVQLVLKRFAYIQHVSLLAETHSRYLQFRAVREFAQDRRYKKLRLLASSRVSPLPPRSDRQRTHDIESAAGLRVEYAAAKAAAAAPTAAASAAADEPASAAAVPTDSLLRQPAAVVVDPERLPAADEALAHNGPTVITVGVSGAAAGAAGGSGVSGGVGKDGGGKVGGGGFMFSSAEVMHQVCMVYIRSTLSAGGVLDRQAADVARALQLSSAGSAWFTSKPLEAAASKKVFQLVFVAMTVIFMQRGAAAIDAWRRGGIFEANALRFTAHGLRDPALGTPADAGVAALGLLRDGCRITPAVPVVTPAAGNATAPLSATALFGGAAVAANGFFFTTEAAGPAGADPVRFLVEASADGGATWAPAAASGWMDSLATGGRQLLPDQDYPTPAAPRGAVAEVSIAPRWAATLRSFGGSFEWGVAMALCLLSAWVGRVGAVPLFFRAASTTSLCISAISAVGFHTVGDARSAVGVWAHTAAQVMLLVAVWPLESRIVAGLLVYSVMYLIAEVVRIVAIHGARLRWTDILASPSMATLIFAVVVVVFRRKALARARRLVTEDRARYDAIWAAVAAAPGAAAELALLRDEVARLAPPRRQSGVDAGTAAAVGPPRQYNRRRDPQMKGMAGLLGVPGELDYSRPVESLDQLYAQASCLQPLLLARVKAWAEASRGCFPIVGTHTYICYSDAAAAAADAAVAAAAAAEDGAAVAGVAGGVVVGGAAGVRFKFGKIKSVARAIEKAVRSYGHDVSRLVDLCRQSIVFESVGDVTACLAAIRADPEVVVLRVKNRLDPGYDSAASAGYRDVALNLRLVGPEACSLGVETHVCELQLILRPIAELKSDEGHKRYVSFRNLRGE